MFLAVGGTKFGSSENGVDWTFSTNGVSGNYRIARAANGTLMAGQIPGYIRKSIDSGANWTNTTYNSYAYSLIHSAVANLWIAGGTSGYIPTSVDGSSWTYTRPYSAYDGTALAESNSLIVAVLSSAGVLCSSSNGVDWTTATGLFAGSTTYYHLLYANSRFVLVGHSGSTGRIYYSDNGTAWNAASGFAGLIRSICWDGSQYIAITTSGSLYTSTTAEIWVSAGTLGYTESNIRRIACLTGGPYVAVSSNDRLYTSPDAVTWSQQVLTSTALQDVIAYGESHVSSLYNHTLKLMCNGGLDWDTDDLRAVLVTADYTFNAAHTARSSISSYEIADSEVTLSSLSVTDTALILPSVIFPGFYGMPSAFVIFKNAVVGGVDQPLLFYSPLGSTTNSGTQLTIVPTSSTFASFA